MNVTLMNARLSFPNLFEPKSVNGEGDPAFSANFLIEPDSANDKALRAAIAKVATEQWKAKGEAIRAELEKKDKIFLHDGNEKTKYEGYEGMLYASARRLPKDGRPLIVDRDKSPLTAEDGRPYGGCYVNVGLDVWAQDNQYGKRINATLLWVQFSKDGDSFGGARRASVDEIPDLAVEADDVSDLA